MATLSQKDMTSHQHDEESRRDLSVQQDVDRLGCETEFDELPTGYYRSRFFIGSMVATGLGLWSATASFVCYSNLSFYIDNDEETDWFNLLGIRRANSHTNQRRPRARPSLHLGFLGLQRRAGHISCSTGQTDRYIRPTVFLHHWGRDWCRGQHCLRNCHIYTRTDRRQCTPRDLLCNANVFPFRYGVSLRL